MADMVALVVSDLDPTLLDVGSAMEVAQGRQTPHSAFDPQQAKRIIESLRFRGFDLTYRPDPVALTITRGDECIEFRMVAVPGTMRYREKFGAQYPDFTQQTRATRGFFAVFRRELWEVYRDLKLVSEEDMQAGMREVPLPEEPVE